MALSIPEGVSTMRGGGWPLRSVRNRPFTAIAPSDDKSTTELYSTPYPKQPLAAMSGLQSLNDPIRTLRSNGSPIPVPHKLFGVQHRTPETGLHVLILVATCAHRHDAAVAPAEPAAHRALYGDQASSAMAFCEPGDRRH